MTKSDHTSKVIKTILEKYDLTGDYINYQLYQQLEDKGVFNNTYVLLFISHLSFIQKNY